MHQDAQTEHLSSSIMLQSNNHGVGSGASHFAGADGIFLDCTQFG